MPGVTKEEIRKRRTVLLDLVQQSNQSLTSDESETSNVIVIPAASKKYMSENIPYPFRQSSNFLYFSGSYDQDAFIVLTATRNEQTHLYFLPDPDPMSELWDGPKTTPQAAMSHYGFNEAFYGSNFKAFIDNFIRHSSSTVRLWCEDQIFLQNLLGPELVQQFKSYASPTQLIDSLRVVKSPSEIALMQKSCDIAAQSFTKAIQFCSQRVNSGTPISEHHIWAKMDYECRLMGAERLAYPPVVASGERAGVIHYIFNANKCNPDDVILVDAGCEFFGYCSDITRTWPMKGKFSSDRHRSLYEMLYEMQVDLIKMTGPGITLDTVFKDMGDMLLKGLKELGIIELGPRFKWNSSNNSSEYALRFCPHHVGHHLGMDVHDTSTVDRRKPLAPGMVVTIEPGIYISDNASQSPFLTKVGKEFVGIGMRIEDDVAITENGNDVLSKNCPKSVRDIEQCAAQQS